MWYLLVSKSGDATCQSARYLIVIALLESEVFVKSTTNDSRNMGPTTVLNTAMPLQRRGSGGSWRRGRNTNAGYGKELKALLATVSSSFRKIQLGTDLLI